MNAERSSSLTVLRSSSKNICDRYQIVSFHEFSIPHRYSDICPLSNLKSVVFPTPFGPTRAIRSFSLRMNRISLRISLLFVSYSPISTLRCAMFSCVMMDNAPFVIPFPDPRIRFQSEKPKDYRLKTKGVNVYNADYGRISNFTCMKSFSYILLRMRGLVGRRRAIRFSRN